MGKIVAGAGILISLVLWGCSAETTIQHTVSDETAYRGALELKDISFCEKIVEETYRTGCISEIEDEKNSERALTENNPSLCQMLSTRDKQDACKIQLEINMAQTQQHETKMEEIQHVNEIVASGKYEDCAKLTDENLRIGCETNIIYDLAVKENNYSLCDKIADAAHRQSCHQLEQMNKQLTPSQQ